MVKTVYTKLDFSVDKKTFLKLPNPNKQKNRQVKKAMITKSKAWMH